MKIFIVCWLLAQVAIADSISYATEGLYRRRGELVPPPPALSEAELNRVLYTELKEQSEDLKKVKYYLLNGETMLAKMYLTQLGYTQTKLRPIVHRYLGILAFIEGDFKKSLEHISRNELQEIPHYAKICKLKILNFIVLNLTQTLDAEWERCKVENYNDLNQDKLVWLQTLIDLKMRPSRAVTRAPFRGTKIAAFEPEELKVYLKLALYLNQEKLVEPQMEGLTEIQLRDPEIRELVGQIYFRLGTFSKSYRFIEDLKSPNAENIKGNLYILREKYELAYAQFKVALKLKHNSQNAMERILPLAWILGDWEDGSKYAEKVIASPQTQINKLTLLAAFLTQKGDFEKARKLLVHIGDVSRRGNEIDVTQLQSFVHLMQNKPSKAKKFAGLSCQQFDLINCWLLFQLEQWDTFPLTIRRNEKIPIKSEWEMLVKETINQPLKETVYVNQIDIEEMDDQLIKLIPQDS